MAGVRVKICGLTRAGDVDAAVRAGAAHVGFVFFPPSPRALSPAAAAGLAVAVPAGVTRVGLVVDATDAEVDAILAAVPLDLLQLHGSESPARVAALRARTGLPVMKAVGIAGPGDIRRAMGYAAAADRLLLDARPPPGAVLPGGNGLAFDWRLIAGQGWPLPWMLAGGLTPGNLAEAVACTAAREVDVSSGVESAPGVKDAARIAAFLAAASRAGTLPAPV
ncbi:MAG: phosphoribosylanthranilate isomerase [Rhodobacteraceae bacterium]|jgi:phosphoribosylanthranilate isomerase|nr:phosphoribosylanthranilate isomerase [Paracoccaceae bacterium]